LVNKWLPSVEDAAVQGRPNRHLGVTLCKAGVRPQRLWTSFADVAVSPSRGFIRALGFRQQSLQGREFHLELLDSLGRCVG